MTRLAIFAALLAAPALSAPYGYTDATPWPVVEPGPTTYMTYADGDPMCVLELRDDLAGGKGMKPLPMCRDLRPRPRPKRRDYAVGLIETLVPYAVPVWLDRGGLVPRAPRQRTGHGGGTVFVGGGGSSTREVETIRELIMVITDCCAICEDAPEQPPVVTPPVAPVPVPAGLPMMLTALVMMLTMMIGRKRWARLDGG